MSSDTSLVFNLVARDRASATMERMKDRMSTAAAGIGAGVAAALGVGVTANLDMEAASDKLAAQLGVGPAKAAELSKVSASVYANAWGESTTDVNEAVKGVYQQIGDTSAAEGGLEGVTTKVMALSQTFDQDLAVTTAAVGQMMKTGMAKDADEALDIITAGMQAGVNKSDDFLETLNEYGTQFRDLGLNGATATGILQQGLQAGARDADVVADAMKELNIRVKDGSAAEGLKKLGLDADAMADAFASGGPKATEALQEITDKLRGVKDPSDRARMAAALLGTQSEDLSQALYAINPDSAVAAIGKVEGAASKMATTVGDNPAAALESFKRKAIMELSEIAGHFVTWAMDNQEIVKPLGIALGGIALTILAIKGGMLAWAAAQTVWAAATGIATAAQWLWNLSMWAWPGTWIIAAILLVIGAIVLLWMKSETFRKIVTGAWNGIKSAAMAVGGWFKNTLWPWIRGVWDNIGKGAGSMWRTVKGWWNTMVNFVSNIPGRISRAASGMWNGVKSAFRSAINWIIGRWNSFSFTIGGGSVMGVSIPSVTLGTPNIPYLAKGGLINQAGTAVVGEAGPELLHLPRGAGVTPLSRGGGSGGAVVVSFDFGRGEDDLTRLLRKAVRVRGRGNVQVAFGTG
ncbi:MAG TPA: hypothetical protein DEQ61_13265 [Streptomyces sp.]|nr:hypothetical protein [Streptomyces sp.]